MTEASPAASPLPSPVTVAAPAGVKVGGASPSPLPEEQDDDEDDDENEDDDEDDDEEEEEEGSNTVVPGLTPNSSRQLREMEAKPKAISIVAPDADSAEMCIICGQSAAEESINFANQVFTCQGKGCGGTSDGRDTRTSGSRRSSACGRRRHRTTTAHARTPRCRCRSRNR